MMVSITLEHGTKDVIILKFMKNGMYSTSLTYKVQFEGLTATPSMHPPMCKFSAWSIDLSI